MPVQLKSIEGGKKRLRDEINLIQMQDNEKPFCCLSDTMEYAFTRRVRRFISIRTAYGRLFQRCSLAVKWR